MLKGHADIYLQDAKTGDIVDERHEDNIVTNAVQELLSLNPYGTKGNNVFYLPLATKALGGVLLFPDTLTEDATKYFAKGIWPTGYASNGVDANADPLRGNFNANESYATATGYRLVWDFGTADANGDIACVCLTSDEGGRGFDLSPYQYTRSIQNNWNDGTKLYFTENGSINSWNVQAYHDNAFYGVTITNNAVGEPVTCVMKKWASPYNKQPVSRGYAIELESSTTIDLSETHIVSLPSSYGASTYRRYTYWDESGCRIFQSDNLQTGRSGKYYVCTIAWDGTVSEIEFSYEDMSNRVETNRSIVFGDWCYIPFKKTENGTKKIGFYAVQLSNTSNILELESEFTGYEVAAEGSNDNSIFRVDTSNAIVQIKLDTGTWVAVLNNGKIVKEWNTSLLSNDGNMIYGLIGPYFYANESGLSAGSKKPLYSKSTYLATINNLGTPITKTADRTLKIIYTLTES